jgi:hypothetical protein
MHRVLAILAKAETFPEIEVFSWRTPPYFQSARDNGPLAAQ